MNPEVADDDRAEDDRRMDPSNSDDDGDTETGTDDDDDNDATETDTGTDNDNDENDDEDATSSADEASILVIPTPDTVEHEYTYPQDFEGKSWVDVVPTEHYFRLILDPACTKIAAEKFKSCPGLIEIVVPDDSCLTTIGMASFSYCKNLQRITHGLPATLLIIDHRAFYHCSSLTGQLVIPPNVTMLGMGSFYYCISLNGQLVIPPNVTFLGSYSFYYCAALTSVVFQPSTTTATTLRIGQTSFGSCTGLLSVDLSERIDELEDNVFLCCTALNRVIIRASNIRFNYRVFGGCSSSLTIEAYPWLYPKIFESINNDSSLMYQTFHQFHHRILREVKFTDDGVVTRQHSNGRHRRRERQLHKRQRLEG